jgi:hypothetical protein
VKNDISEATGLLGKVTPFLLLAAVFASELVIRFLSPATD